MNDILKLDDLPPQRMIDAILVDFVNFCGVFQGCDLGLYTKDINK